MACAAVIVGRRWLSGPKDFPQARLAKVRADLARFVKALDEYALSNAGRYPATLEALVTPRWSGDRYLQSTRVPLDPWGAAYGYAPPAAGDESVRVWSHGPDGRAGSEDDIERHTANLSLVPDLGPANEATARGDITRILAALNELALLNEGRHPATLDLLVAADEERERLLALDGIPTDPWGRVYHYAPPAGANAAPRVWTDGADGAPGGGDDVQSWTMYDRR
jgi:hypothetical protein